MLEFTDNTYAELVEELVDDDTLIVTGSHGYPLLKELGQAVEVRDNSYHNVERAQDEYEYSKVVAFGGCTSLDMGRAIAAGKELIVIPASLSTCGIAAAKSIINYDGVDKAERTTTPTKVIVSIPSMLDTDPERLERLSRSGFGDYLANISASIDVQYRAGDLSMDAIRNNVPGNFEAMEWVVDNFDGYNEECLQHLANYTHNGAVAVIVRGNNSLSAGGEHKLYYHMMEQHDRYHGAPLKPTHGEMVAAGTLVAAKVLAEETNQQALYDNLCNAYTKLGLPTDYDGLSAIGIERDHLVQGLGAITDTDPYMGAHFAQGDYAVLDRVFGG